MSTEWVQRSPLLHHFWQHVQSTQRRELRDLDNSGTIVCPSLLPMGNCSHTNEPCACIVRKTGIDSPVKQVFSRKKGMREPSQKERLSKVRVDDEQSKTDPTKPCEKWGLTLHNRFKAAAMPVPVEPKVSAASCVWLAEFAETGGENLFVFGTD